MGFDLYGLNPKIKEGSVKPERPTDMKDQAEIDEYVSAMEKFESENKGYYFRNNNWWWRPLANFVINNTLCIEKKDIENWHVNDGHKVNKETAEQIAKQLYHLIKIGEVKRHEEELAKIAKQAKEHNKKLQKKFDALEKKAIEKTGDKDIAPADYPKEFKEEWDRLWADKDWRDSYPFSVSNVKEFADFCKESGGFEIC
jgi:hypothetical protein